jgi:hypothetical protein
MSAKIKIRPQSCVEPELYKAVLAYIEWHGGLKGKFVNFICDTEGYSVILVRFLDVDTGAKMSAFLDYSHMYSDPNGKILWDISERTAFDRDDEDVMIAALERYDIEAV